MWKTRENSVIVPMVHRSLMANGGWRMVDAF
jgi:hypothetical protein